MKLTRLLSMFILSLFFGTSGYAQCLTGDCMNGQGTYLFKNKSAKYIGEFVQGKPEGNGVCDYANGDRYEGEWVEGLFSGTGKLIRKNGKKLEGSWDAGRFVAAKTILAKSNNISEQKAKQITPTHPKGKTWALVVGVASYEHMPVLRYADDDAWLFYSNLIANSGVAINEDQVKILIDEAATRDNILSQLKDITQKAGPNDLVLFYFSGHGYEGSFLPIDYDGFSNKLFHTEVNAILAQTVAKQKICIADACHSGSLFAAKGSSAEQYLSLYRDFSIDNSGTALMLSSKSKETSLESNGLRHGVFTYFLVKGLKGAADTNKDSVIVLQEVYDYLYQEVRSYTGRMQSPLLKGDFDPNFPIRILDR